MNAKSLPLRHRVGQLLIMGFEGTEVSTHLRSTLRTLQPGGVILFRRNLNSPDQCFQLLRQCANDALLPQFRCVDLEGGTVDRFRDMIAPAPAAETVFNTGKKSLFIKHGRLIGEEIRALGFNVDFAPVSDLGLPASKQVLTTRTVSPDPERVIAYVHGFLKGLKAAKVLGCGKHFPGLGEAQLDTHKDSISINKPWKALWQEDLLPYRKLHDEFPFALVAHASYPLVTGDSVPASLSSKWMRDILRKKIGYRGLIVPDDLEMGGVLAASSMEEIAVETIRSGADIFLICQKEELVWSGYEAVLREAERSRKFEKLVDQALARVLRLKNAAKELRPPKLGPTETQVLQLRENMEAFREEIAKAGSNQIGSSHIDSNKIDSNKIDSNKIDLNKMSSSRS